MRVSNSGRRPTEPTYKTDSEFIQNRVNGKGAVENKLSSVKEKSVENVEKSVDKSESIKVNNLNKTEKQDKPVSVEKLPRIGVGKILLMIVVGVITSVIIFGCISTLYKKQITYPSMMEVEDKTTGSYCIRNWQNSINTMDESLVDLIGSDKSYIYEEIKYANGNEDRLRFIESVASTVGYKLKQVKALNKYGNVMVDESGSVVYKDSDLKEGEKVTLSYVDYSAIEVDKEAVRMLLQENELRVGDVDYSAKLVDMFCKYINSIEKLPIKTEEGYIPNIIKQGKGYTVTPDEDVYIDKLLFSSTELKNLMEKFSVAAGGTGLENPEWTKWNKLPKKKKKKNPEPIKILEELQPTSEWLKWNTIEEDKRAGVEEPVKYDRKVLMDTNWCGAYYLQNEYTDEEGKAVTVKAMIGNGSFDNPAGIDTDVLTSVFVTNEKDKEVEVPIKIRLKEYGVSEDAIKWLESKDERNRGIDVRSEVQYIYYCFEITNMGTKELVVLDNISLSDSNANMSSRTGEMFGLTDKLVLKPDESGVLETWGMSTELNKKYVVWGKNFNRRKEPVWFRVLMGDLEDKTEEKGVLLNTNE